LLVKIGMAYISGASRREVLLLPECLEDFIGAENETRVIDAFVDRLDMVSVGLEQSESACTGRPGYAPADLLKLWLWGYVNRVTSSRKLERECSRNLEVLWLMRRLRPDHWTICAFRRRAGAALKKVLREFVTICQQLELVGGQRVVIDGTKLKASNHPSKQYSSEQLAQKIAALEADIEAYLQGCEASDAELTEPAPLKQLKQELKATEQLETKLKQSGRPTIASTDPECRPVRKVGLGYNAQIAVDSAHHLIVAAEIVDAPNDQQQLVPMAQKARQGLGQTPDEPLEIVTDAGYYDRVSLAAAEEANFLAYVPRPKKGHGQERGLFHKSEFVYEAKHDVYRCPAGAQLQRETQALKRGLLVFKYSRPAACQQCPVRAKCTTQSYRRVERWEKEEVLDRADARLAANPEMMRTRRSVVEHPFGTIKFWNNQYAFLTRGFVGVGTEFTLSALAYNLKRLVRLLPLKQLLSKIGGIGGRFGCAWMPFPIPIQRAQKHLSLFLGMTWIFSLPDPSNSRMIILKPKSE
jgi:transposase